MATLAPAASKQRSGRRSQDAVGAAEVLRSAFLTPLLVRELLRRLGVSQH